jgi:drug/metabolite transporter (DMT)-like permease
MAASTRSASTQPAAFGTTAAVTAVISWGIGPVVVKGTNLPGLVVSFYRLDLGALAMAVILYASGRRLSWRLLSGAIAGGVAFGLDIVLFFTALKLTTVADATIISALQPALVLLVVGRFFGEQVRRGDVLLTVVAIGGVGVVVFASGHVVGRSLLGDLLATLALGAWAWYFVAVKQARRRFAALEYQAGLAIISAAVVTPVVLVSGEGLQVPDTRTWALLAGMVGLGAGGHFLMNWAHAYTPLMLTSLLTLASPVISVAAAAAFLGEPVLTAQVIGMAIVLSSLGIVLARSTASDRRPRPCKVSRIVTCKKAVRQPLRATAIDEQLEKLVGRWLDRRELSLCALDDPN